MQLYGPKTLDKDFSEKDLNWPTVHITYAEIEYK